MRFLLGLLAGAIWAASLPPLKFTDTHLANGLRVIISEDHAAPVVAVSVTYAVGAKDERPGRTGFAHLFEHMMFKGSENVGGGEHFYHIFSNGGVMNGSTSKDRTNYFELLPKNQLDLALFLESDRMRSLAITKENLENQRQAVKEERRLNYDNRPYGLIYEKASELVYQNFPYKHVPIGSMEDLDAASVDDVKQFFQTYYAPNNANLAIVGDVDTKSTLEKVKKYFGDIPRQEAPKRPDLAEPVQAAEKRIIINDKLARLPRVDVFYKAAPATSKDFAVLTVIDELLGTGESSRLYQKLVKETESAVQANSTRMGHVGPGLFGVTAIVPPRGSKA
jgi:predicted Zn-dependent peptidase